MGTDSFKSGSVRRRVWAIGVSCALLAALYLLSKYPLLVESAYSQVFFPLAVRALSLFSAPFPFSVAEVLLAIVALWLLTSVARALKRLMARRINLSSAIGTGALNLSAVGASVLAAGYLFWGLNYARPDAATRLNWRAEAVPDAVELVRIAEEAVRQTNLSREAVQATAAGGWDAAIDQGFAQASAALGLDPVFSRSLGPAKPIGASFLLSYFGLSGFYFPWTGEANYNRLAPAPERLHSIAHEKAHQRGVASEDEANFFGFLACVHSSNADVRYSGLLFAQRQLLRQLFRLDAEAAAQLAKLRSPKVIEDEAAIRRFWSLYQGPAMKVGAAVNDSYLRFHGAPGGIRSYEESVRLLVLYWRIKSDYPPFEAR